ncbi:chalcone isomerase family protein [Amphibiibacter pelophylacis]|uniref:Chalcone isomerase family protein n=1 Tax=Amphibiibacter pelophylacis TaxID=1799477 RepID=A0ACC6NZP7_9BURK
MRPDLPKPLTAALPARLLIALAGACAPLASAVAADAAAVPAPASSPSDAGTTTAPPAAAAAPAAAVPYTVPSVATPPAGIVGEPLPAAPASAPGASPSPAPVTPAPAAPVWTPPTASIGPVRVTYWGIHAYDITLWKRASFDLAHYEQHDLILQLAFARDFLSADLARRASAKMADLARWGSATREQWRQTLASLIPDIKRGDILSIEHRADQGVQLRLNNRPLGSINDPAFARAYLGLWLSSDPADGALRRAVMRPPAS